jgi:predicted nucleotidyltransferase
MEVELTVRNPCCNAKIAPCYRAIVDEAIGAYTRIWGSRIREIRLMGSVARGDALAPFSDIDFMALFSKDPTAEQAERLAREAIRLTAKFDCVSKVDLEIAVPECLGEARHFILSSDSVNLWGDDLYTAPEQRLTGRKLAEMLTPDLDGILRRYQETVRGIAEDNAELLLQWSRWSGKDVLKCLRKHVLLGGGAYERAITAIYLQLCDHIPRHRNLVDALYELYIRPEPDKARILSVLALADTELPKE